MALSKRILDKIKPVIPSIDILSFQLLIESYNLALIDKKYQFDWTEDQFTNYLINFMRRSSLNEKYPLDITPQYPLIQDTLPIEENNPKTLPIIDIRIFNWNSSVQKEYFFEAKNLCENDWIKKSGAKVSSSHYQNRYIETGIENFRKGRYYNGAIIAYVLHGKTANIISKLNNRLLKDTNTFQDIQVLNYIPSSKDIYNSIHLMPSSSNLEIKHIFLKF